MSMTFGGGASMALRASQVDARRGALGLAVYPVDVWTPSTGLHRFWTPSMRSHQLDAVDAPPEIGKINAPTR